MPKVAQVTQLRFDQLPAAIVFAPAQFVTNYNFSITDQSGAVVLSLDNTSATPINGTPFVGIKLADMVQSKPVIAGAYTINVVSRAINQGDSDSDPSTASFSLNANRANAIQLLLNPVAPPIIPSTHPAIPSTTAAAPTVPTNQPLTNERKVVRWFLLALGLAIIATCLYFASRSKTTECDSNPVDTITTNTCQNNGIYQVAKMGNISGSNVFNGPVNCNFAFPAVGVTITNIWVSPEAQSSPSQPQSKVLTQQNQTFNQGQVQIIETYGPPVFVGGNWCVSLGFGRGWIRCDDPRSGYQFGGHGWEHRYGWLESWQQRFDFHQNDRREFRFSK